MKKKQQKITRQYFSWQSTSNPHGTVHSHNKIARGGSAHIHQRDFVRGHRFHFIYYVITKQKICVLQK